MWKIMKGSKDAPPAYEAPPADPADPSILYHAMEDYWDRAHREERRAAGRDKDFAQGLSAGIGGCLTMMEEWAACARISLDKEDTWKKATKT